MAKFCFYGKNDLTQSPIGATEAPSREQAVQYFSLVKMLPANDFLAIFNVKEFTHEENTTRGNKQLLKG